MCKSDQVSTVVGDLIRGINPQSKILELYEIHANLKLQRNVGELLQKIWLY